MINKLKMPRFPGIFLYLNHSHIVIGFEYELALQKIPTIVH